MGGLNNMPDNNLNISTCAEVISAIIYGFTLLAITNQNKKNNDNFIQQQDEQRKLFQLEQDEARNRWLNDTYARKEAEFILDYRTELMNFYTNFIQLYKAFEWAELKEVSCDYILKILETNSQQCRAFSGLVENFKFYSLAEIDSNNGGVELSTKYYTYDSVIYAVMDVYQSMQLFILKKQVDSNIFDFKVKKTEYEDILFHSFKLKYASFFKKEKVDEYKTAADFLKGLLAWTIDSLLILDKRIMGHKNLTEENIKKYYLRYEEQLNLLIADSAINRL